MLGDAVGHLVDSAVGAVGITVGSCEGDVGAKLGTTVGVGVSLGLAVVINVLGIALILVYPSLLHGTTSSYPGYVSPFTLPFQPYDGFVQSIILVNSPPPEFPVNPQV